jgi:hypothetical protein
MSSRARRTVPVIVIAAVAPLMAAGVVYYYFVVLTGGLLTIPTIYDARLPVSDGGHLAIQGVGETGFRAKGTDWRVHYVPPGGGRTEDVGAWLGAQPEFMVAKAAGRLVFAAPPERLFVRTARGAWKEFSFRYVEMWESNGIRVGGLARLRAELALTEDKPLPTGWVVYVSSEREEVAVDVGVPGVAVAGRLYFSVSEDGESLTLLRGQAPTAP